MLHYHFQCWAPLLTTLENRPECSRIGCYWKTQWIRSTVARKQVFIRNYSIGKHDYIITHIAAFTISVDRTKQIYLVCQVYQYGPVQHEKTLQSCLCSFVTKNIVWIQVSCLWASSSATLGIYKLTLNTYVLQWRIHPLRVWMWK